MGTSFSPLIHHSASGKTVPTNFGEKSVSSLNMWNNTAFSQLCLHKTDAELKMLANNPYLNADKRQIASSKLEERHGVAVSNQV